MNWWCRYPMLHSRNPVLRPQREFLSTANIRQNWHLDLGVKFGYFHRPETGRAASPTPVKPPGYLANFIGRGLQLIFSVFNTKQQTDTGVSGWQTDTIAIEIRLDIAAVDNLRCGALHQSNAVNKSRASWVQALPVALRWKIL